MCAERRMDRIRYLMVYPKMPECAKVVHLGPLCPGGIIIQDILPFWMGARWRTPYRYMEHDEVRGQRGSKAANFNFNNGNRNWNNQSNSNNKRALPVRGGKWTCSTFFLLRTFTKLTCGVAKISAAEKAPCSLR